MTSILVVHGPNLGTLGRRQPEIYGTTTLADINQTLVDAAGEWKWGVSSFQANGEGALIDGIEQRTGQFDGMMINPGSYTRSGGLSCVFASS